MLNPDKPLFRELLYKNLRIQNIHPNCVRNTEYPPPNPTSKNKVIYLLRGQKSLLVKNAATLNALRVPNPWLLVRRRKLAWHYKKNAEIRYTSATNVG